MRAENCAADEPMPKTSVIGCQLFPLSVEYEIPATTPLKSRARPRIRGDVFSVGFSVNAKSVTSGGVASPSVGSIGTTVTVSPAAVFGTCVPGDPGGRAESFSTRITVCISNDSV